MRASVLQTPGSPSVRWKPHIRPATIFHQIMCRCDTCSRLHIAHCVSGKGRHSILMSSSGISACGMQPGAMLIPAQHSWRCAIILRSMRIRLIAVWWMVSWSRHKRVNFMPAGSPRTLPGHSREGLAQGFGNRQPCRLPAVLMVNGLTRRSDAIRDIQSDLDCTHP